MSKTENRYDIWQRVKTEVAALFPAQQQPELSGGLAGLEKANAAQDATELGKIQDDPIYLNMIAEIEQRLPAIDKERPLTERAVAKARHYIKRAPKHVSDYERNQIGEAEHFLSGTPHSEVARAAIQRWRGMQLSDLRSRAFPELLDENRINDFKHDLRIAHNLTDGCAKKLRDSQQICAEIIAAIERRLAARLGA